MPAEISRSMICTTFLIGAFFLFSSEQPSRAKRAPPCEGCAPKAQCPSAHPSPAGGGTPPAVTQRRARARPSPPAAQRARGGRGRASAARGAGASRQERSSQSQSQGQRGQNQPYKNHILYDILAIQNISRFLYDWIAARRARRRGRAARLSAAPPERRARSPRGGQLRTKAAPTPRMVILGCSGAGFACLRPSGGCSCAPAHPPYGFSLVVSLFSVVYCVF